MKGEEESVDNKLKPVKKRCREKFDYFVIPNLNLINSCNANYSMLNEPSPPPTH